MAYRSISEVPQWKSELSQLRPGVYAYVQEEGTWGRNNAGFIEGPDEILVVDSQFTVGQTEAYLAAIKRVTDKPARWLYYTHHHADHTFGSILFPEATIVAYDGCYERMLHDRPDPVYFGQVFPQRDFTGSEARFPDLTFATSFCQYIGGRPVEFLKHTHAHTSGDAIVHLPEDKVVFCGDVLFNYITPNLHEGSCRGWILFLELLLDLKADYYVPGHGPVSGREGIAACYEYLTRLYAQGTRLFDAGVPVDEAARRVDIGPFKAWALPGRIVTNLERLYRELQGQHPHQSPMHLEEMLPRVQAFNAWLAGQG